MNAMQRRWLIAAILSILVLLIAGITAFRIAGGRREPENVASAPGNGSANAGIRMENDAELRDRLLRVMARREAETPPADGADALRLQKLYDAALLYFARTAREIWPDMDLSPMERCALFDGAFEREEYVGLARRLIGPAVIDKPEDLTYWVNKETLQALFLSDQMR